MNKQIICLILLVGLSFSLTSNLKPLYRHFNSQLNDHFYTTSLKESENFLSEGYAFEFIQGRVLENPVEGSVSIIRLFSDTLNDHFYTADSAEKYTFIADGYDFENVEGFLLGVQAQGSVPLYRLFNPTSHDHFYTSSETERTEKLGDGYNDEGISGYIFPADSVEPVYTQPTFENAKSTILYRLFNPTINDHFYTINKNERNQFLTKGYKSEQNQGYVLTQWVEGTTPLLRAFNPKKNDHFYTNDEAELLNFLQNQGYDYEGIEGYVNIYQEAGQHPFFRLYNPLTFDHFYTISQVEKLTSEETKGYNHEGIPGYIFDCQSAADAFAKQFNENFVQLIPLYAFFNAQLNDHMLTNTTEETESLVSKGYVYEGISFYVLKTPVKGSLTFNRLFNQETNDHFYTQVEVEKEQFMQNGYKFEAANGFVITIQVQDSIPLYRLFNQALNDHFYTDDLAVKAEFMGNGYTYEGIVGYVFEKGGTYSDAGLKPDVAKWYRAFQPDVNDHFYTTSLDEQTQMKQKGYIDEGVVGYISSTWVIGSVPLFKLFHNSLNDHFYTTDPNELLDFVNRQLYFFQGIDGYVFQEKGDNAQAINRLFNPILHDHFYTTSVSEKLQYQKKGYKFEGITGYLYPSSVGASEHIGINDESLAALIPVFRAYNAFAHDHFYTNDPVEYEKSVQDGYAKEGISAFQLATPVEGSKPFYRLFNSELNDHFYTADLDEQQEFIADEGYVYQGVMGFILEEQQYSSVPLHRLFHPTSHDHFYTVSEDEKTSFIADGYVSEGISGYVFLYEGSFKQDYFNSDAVPLYRLFNPELVDHFYTRSLDEVATFYTNGYVSQGIAGWVSSQWFAGGTPIFRAYQHEVHDHFYTVNALELDTFLNNNGYTYEGIEGYISTKKVGNAVPFNRFLNFVAHDHVYTAFEDEILSQGQTFEGILGYIFQLRQDAQEFYQNTDINKISLATVHRLYNPTSHDHVYTVSDAEVVTFKAAGYVYEQIQCYVLTTPDKDSISIKRFFNPDLVDHFYTTSNPEKYEFIAKNYDFESILGYVLPFYVPGSTILYRLFNSQINDHFYTTSAEEAQDYLQRGYHSEADIGYVFTQPDDFIPFTRIPNAIQLYRVHNTETHDHFYTIREDEKVYKQQNGYLFEEPIGYCSNYWITGSTPLYRVYNPIVNDHYYITDDEELANAQTAAEGYDFEEISCYLLRTQIAQTVPVQKLFNSVLVDHFYVIEEQETSAPGYAFQSIVGYIFPNKDVAEQYINSYQDHVSYYIERPIPLYRFYNRNAHDHYFTTVFTDAAVNYDYEGIACYVLANPYEATFGLTQLFNSQLNDHFYSTDLDSIVTQQAINYEFVTTNGFIQRVQIDGFSTPLFQLFNNDLNDHFYTSLVEERDAYKNNGYVDEGIIGYVFSYEAYFVVSKQDASYVLLERLYNTQTHDHVYITSINEAQKDDLISNGYDYEAIAGFISQIRTPGTTSLYSAFNPYANDHFYTASKSELFSFINTKGYIYLGVESYILTKKVPKSQPLYRLFNSKIVDHFYTFSNSERVQFLAQGYKPEGITGYVFTNQNDAINYFQPC